MHIFLGDRPFDNTYKNLLNPYLIPNLPLHFDENVDCCPRS